MKLVVATAFLCGLAGAASAQSMSILYEFSSFSAGSQPSGSLLQDASGNLYGAAFEGGLLKGAGTIFELTPPAAGQTAWTESTLFGFNGQNGDAPDGALVADRAGNLYGSTVYGGGASRCTYGCGTVFELIRPAAGQTKWTEQILRIFAGRNSSRPSPVIFDGQGNLYGTAEFGGRHGDGLVFELSPPTGGAKNWRRKILFSFRGKDGAYPSGALIFGPDGSLYSSTSMGGISTNCGALGCGVVFRLSPPAAGDTRWSETVIHSFSGTDGREPLGGVIFNAAGDIFGTTELGGLHGNGNVYELMPTNGGNTPWTEAFLYGFDGRDGAEPSAAPVFDGVGNLYISAVLGGDRGCFDRCGTVVKLTPPAGGSGRWTGTTDIYFDGTNGEYPNGLILGSSGQFFGSAIGGSRGAAGVVYSLTP